MIPTLIIKTNKHITDMNTKVTLRKEKISKNRHSYYLDFYPAIMNPDTGKPTRRQFLKLYVYDKPKTITEKNHNKETTTLAEHLRQKRETELNKDNIYSEFEKERLAEKAKADSSFIDYFKQLTDKRHGENKKTWLSAFNYLQNFTQGKLRFSDVTETFCNDFKAYLLSTPCQKNGKDKLSPNSALSYFNKVKATMKQAYKDGYLKTDLNSRIAPIKATETHRQYLSFEELNTLAQTPAPIKAPVMKPAALFSALTGLRFSDIEKLKWNEVRYSEAQGHYLQFTQKKTKGTETLQISTQAFQMLGERDAPEAFVFPKLVYSAYQNKILSEWIAAAGITKHITFHSFRHTYATLLLTEGVDLYTVSKMLGHRELKTTQIYAKVIDSKKRTAADSIKPLDFSPNNK